MAKLFVSQNSSLEFYYKAQFNDSINLLEDNPFNNSLKLQSGNFKVPNKLNSFDEIMNIDIPYLGEHKLHLTTSYKNRNHHIAKVKYHYIKGELPRNSFYKLSNEIYIASPELMFIQMANTLDFLELVELGFELCGTYLRTTLSPDGFIYNISPLTTKRKLKNYIMSFKKRNNNYKGIRKAQKVVELILDKSASPKETDLIIKLCGPRNIGGYEVNDLVANNEIHLSKGATQILGRSKIRPDLCCPKSKIAIEYQSKMYHNNAEQFEIDKVRAAALFYDGWKLISIVPSQLRNVFSFHEIAATILLSNRQDTRIRTKNFEEKRKNLWMGLAKIGADVWEHYF